MQTVQRLLLLLFAAFAALTVLQQIRYGMICGRSEQEDKQDDPKAKACRQQSTIYAIAAAVSLIAVSYTHLDVYKRQGQIRRNDHRR